MPLDRRTKRKSERAQSMQDRCAETRSCGDGWVGVERVQVATEPVQQGEIGRDGHADARIGLTLGQGRSLGRRVLRATKSAVAATEETGAEQGRRRFVIAEKQRAFGGNDSAAISALVDDVDNPDRLRTDARADKGRASVNDCSAWTTRE